MSQSSDDTWYLPALDGIAAGVHRGRVVREGYQRGWGLQYGGLREKVLADPLYLHAVEKARSQFGHFSEENCMNMFLLLKFFLPALPFGHIIEFGCFRGGSAIFMGAVCEELFPGRMIFTLDTFEGMPETDPRVDAHSKGDFAQTSFAEVTSAIHRAGLKNVRPCKGLFEDTAAAVLQEAGAVALAHIDCDIRSACNYARGVIRPFMVRGGYIVFDDATMSSCIGATEAVEEMIHESGVFSEQIWPHFVFRHGLEDSTGAAPSRHADRLPMTPLFPLHVEKTDAVRQIAARHRQPDVDPWGETVGEALMRLLHLEETRGNPGVDLIEKSAALGEEVTFAAGSARRFESPLHLAGRPECFPPSGGENAFSPALKILAIRNGFVLNFCRSPVIFSADGVSVPIEYSSRYAPLIHFYDVDPAALLGDAIQVDGTAIVLLDDIYPANFCHWLLDALPRLACLGALARRPDYHVVVPPLTAAFQRESLLMCGFDTHRIIEVENFQAVQARQLLVSNDLRNPPHPAFKAAPWALAYLQSTIATRSILAHRQRFDCPKKIYVSRADAGGRRIVNEDALLELLQTAGYVSVQLSAMVLSEQVALFAGATHVVAMHGAGLSHLAFLVDRAAVIEIFPSTYGTPTYYVLTAGMENRYASYVCADVVSNACTQLDDVRIDVADFRTRCGDFL